MELERAIKCWHAMLSDSLEVRNRFNRTGVADCQKCQDEKSAYHNGKQNATFLVENNHVGVRGLLILLPVPGIANAVVQTILSLWIHLEWLVLGRLLRITNAGLPCNVRPSAILADTDDVQALSHARALIE